MNDGKDVRDLTRAVIRLAQATEKLNKTVSESMRRTVIPSQSAGEVLSNIKEWSDGLYAFCGECMMSNCVVGIVYVKSCECCKNNHTLK